LDGGGDLLQSAISICPLLSKLLCRSLSARRWLHVHGWE